LKAVLVATEPLAGAAAGGLLHGVFAAGQLARVGVRGNGVAAALVKKIVVFHSTILPSFVRFSQSFIRSFIYFQKRMNER
jgi:hypothetical protein